MTTHHLPYRSSPFAHLCYLVSEALRGPVLTSTEAESYEAPKRWLDRIDHWAWQGAQKRRDAYLAQSTDLADLELRLRALERGAFWQRGF